MQRPRLTKKFYLNSLSASDDQGRLPDYFDLPEKVLQFGSGNFLRAFADLFVHQANLRGIFNGRVVIVQSTAGQNHIRINEQDGLYTVCIRGQRDTECVYEHVIVSSVSRALFAPSEWAKVLQCARNPHLQIIISNTTEAGFKLEERDRLESSPPNSFPAKLTCFLHQRFQAFEGAHDKGLCILPCELIEGNGDVLADLVMQIAAQWALGDAFMDWLKASNVFCNTLVDRIVAGPPDSASRRRIEACTGYVDELMTTTEKYCFWAIEGGLSLNRTIEFAQDNPEIVIAADIRPYRERKVRLLNGVHSLLAPMGLLMGKRFVDETMRTELLSEFVDSVMRQEIGPTIVQADESVRGYVDQVIDRLQNSSLKHRLTDIARQTTLKLRERVVPTIQDFHSRFGRPPARIAFAFASYLLFMRSKRTSEGTFHGRSREGAYEILDEQAGFFHDLWSGADQGDSRSIEALVISACDRKRIWGSELSAITGFSETVSNYLRAILNHGLETILRDVSCQAERRV